MTKYVAALRTLAHDVPAGAIGKIMHVSFNTVEVAFPTCLIETHVSEFAPVRKARSIIKAKRKLMQRPWNGAAVARNDAARLMNANAKRMQGHKAYKAMFPAARIGSTMLHIMYRDYNDAHILRHEANRF